MALDAVLSLNQDRAQFSPNSLAVRSDDALVVAHELSYPFIKGSYVSNHPSYFTTIAGNEATPVDNLFFAGEHTDSFYEWQGFMEGAANSGIRAAQEILAAF